MIFHISNTYREGSNRYINDVLKSVKLPLASHGGFYKDFAQNAAH